MPESDSALTASASSSINANTTNTPATPSTSNRGSWFSDLRAKLNQFSAVDFFSNLGFASKHQNQNGGGGTTSENRKTSVRGGGLGNNGGILVGTNFSSRSVMNLSTHVDNSNSPMLSTTINENLLSPDDNANNLGTTNSDIASSTRHHSDEPRRRLFINSTSVVEKKELDQEPIWRMKQKSEPPNLWSSDGDRGGSHDDEERPTAIFSGDYDSATMKLDNVGIDVVSACDVQRFGTLSGLIPTGKRDVGVGHTFEASPAGYPTWCDKCGDFISGLNEGQAVRCRHCRFTCHLQCQPLVTLDCRSSTNSLKSENSSLVVDRRDGEVEKMETRNDDAESQKARDVDFESVAETDTTELNDIDPEEISEIVEEITDELQRDLPRGDNLRRLINEYNKETADGLAMTLEDDGITFRGFLQIHMNFSRPINVVAGEHPPTIYEVLVTENDQDASSSPSDHNNLAITDGRKTITSFYLPRNTMKVLHITSETTTSEMIVSLLKKFKVADNPRKFALYERDLEPGKTLQARLLRIPEEACPLRLALFWGCRRKTGRFVLQENETGDIMWEAFEIPELQNFLKILDIEENQYVKQMEQRYYVYRYWLEAEIRHRLSTRKSSKQQAKNDDESNRGLLDDDGLDEESAVEV